jgi:beta-glucanase (GH16 family)
MLDRSKFRDTPEWADEFEGDALDRTKWHCHHGDGTTVRRGGYYNMDMVEVRDSCLHIKTEYLPEGIDGGPPGYYSCGINTSGLFEQAFGYFEARCKLPKGPGQWAAFWLLCGGMGNADGTGHGGAEIDVFESPFYFRRWRRLHNAICANVHIDGYGKAHKTANICRAVVPGDPYGEFHTYGLEWNEGEYTIYVDGKKCGSSRFGGTSRVPEYLILSVEVGHAGGEWSGVPGRSWAGDIRKSGQLPSEFVVDYVRVYQYK